MNRLTRKKGKGDDVCDKGDDVCDICMNPLEKGEDAFCYTESEYFYMLHAEGVSDGEIWEKLKEERALYLKLCDTCHTAFKFLMRARNISMEEAIAQLCLIHESNRYEGFEGAHFTVALTKMVRN